MKKMTTQTTDYVNKTLYVNDEDFIVQLRKEDCFINATAIANATKCRLYDWLKNKKTKLLQTELEKTHRIVVDVIDGKESRYPRGTWLHPQLALEFTKWCSTCLISQVEKWIKDFKYPEKSLISYDDWTKADLIEKIKNHEENEELLNKKLIEALNAYTNLELNFKEMEIRLSKISITYQSSLRRKMHYKLKEGRCVYIMDMAGTGAELYYKVGQTGDISRRCSDFKTNAPNLKVLFVLYTDQNVELEHSILLAFKKNRIPINSEFISGVPKEVLIETCINLANAHNYEFTVEHTEELDKLNGIETIYVEKKEETEPVGVKRCGGSHHTTEEERMQPLSNFFKNGHHKDGYARLCKECYLTGVYGDKRKRRKTVVIPKFNTTTHKWCNRCESVKEYREFGKDSTTKDGYCPNCRDCKSEQKRNYKQKLREKNNKKAEEKETSVEVEETDEFEIVMEDETMDIDLMSLNVE